MAFIDGLPRPLDLVAVRRHKETRIFSERIGDKVKGSDRPGRRYVHEATFSICRSNFLCVYKDRDNGRSLDTCKFSTYISISYYPTPLFLNNDF